MAQGVTLNSLALIVNTPYPQSHHIHSPLPSAPFSARTKHEHRVTRMLTYTIALGARSADKPLFSDVEAGEMAQLGFRFAEFRPETGLYRLSPSYRTLHNLDRGTLTFQQAESETRRLPSPPPTDLAPTELGPPLASGTVPLANSPLAAGK